MTGSSPLYPPIGDPLRIAFFCDFHSCDHRMHRFNVPSANHPLFKPASAVSSALCAADSANLFQYRPQDCRVHYDQLIGIIHQARHLLGVILILDIYLCNPLADPLLRPVGGAAEDGPTRLFNPANGLVLVELPKTRRRFLPYPLVACARPSYARYRRRPASVGSQSAKWTCWSKCMRPGRPDGQRAIIGTRIPPS